MHVSITGLDELLARMKGSEAIVVRRFRIAIGRAAALLQTAARLEVPIDRGILRNSISIGDLTGLTGNVVATAPYASYVHDGRQPGSFPPLDAIREWVRRKGLPEGAAFPIAQKIAEEGIDPVPFFDRAIQNTEGALAAIWEGAAEDVVKELGVQ